MIQSKEYSNIPSLLLNKGLPKLINNQQIHFLTAIFYNYVVTIVVTWFYKKQKNGLNIGSINALNIHDFE